MFVITRLPLIFLPPLLTMVSGCQVDTHAPLAATTHVEMAAEPSPSPLPKPPKANEEATHAPSLPTTPVEKVVEVCFEKTLPIGTRGQPEHEVRLGDCEDAALLRFEKEGADPFPTIILMSQKDFRVIGRSTTRVLDGDHGLVYIIREDIRNLPNGIAILPSVPRQVFWVAGQMGLM